MVLGYRGLGRSSHIQVLGDLELGFRGFGVGVRQINTCVVRGFKVPVLEDLGFRLYGIGGSGFWI